MRVVLTGTEGCGIDRAERELRAAGHEVVHCVASCVDGPRDGAIDLRGCPRWGGVDVVVTAREHPLPRAVRAERVVRCPLLAAVPLVVSGCPLPNPFEDRAAAETFGYDDLAAACEAVASAGSRS